MATNPLDEAKKRWGTAQAITGGGQAAPALDLSPWQNLKVGRHEEKKTGIADVHFDVFLTVAAQRKAVVLVRRGKASCLPWIKLNYPAKPASIWKIKSSKFTGLVTCSDDHPRYGYEEQLLHAWGAGHYVLVEEELEEVPMLSGAGKGYFKEPGTVGLSQNFARIFVRKPGPMKPPQHSMYLRARRNFELLPDRFPKEHHELGQVIDPHSHLPLTGDYDLMGAFPIDSPGSKTLVKIHDATDPKAELEAVKLPQAPGQPPMTTLLLKMRDNPYCKEIERALNAGFGTRPRIMHGPHDLKYDPADQNEDGATVFHPQGAFFLPTAQSVSEFYRLIDRLGYLPGPERAAKR